MRAGWQGSTSEPPPRTLASLERAAELGHRLEDVTTRAAPTLQRRPLPDPLRAKMERAFQQDFSGVRLRLSDAPSRLGARALTRGEEITFSPRHYQPDSASGQALLGHELAHVVQQRAGRVRPPNQAGDIYDQSSLEAEADRQGAQAARGAQVSAAAPGPLPARTSPGAPAAALPFQPAWEYVELGGRVVRKNLKDNQDGTYTLSSSGQVYSHTGKVDPKGNRVLTPHNPPTPGGPVPQPSLGSTSHDPKNVLFGIQETGKVEYLANTSTNRQAHAGKFLEMAPEDFALFKNSGKRRESPKVMDPVTLKRYAYEEPKGQFYEWDNSASDRRGTALDTTPGLNGTPSENQALLDRFKKGELVDRRRKDRTGKELQPFDVGTYKTSVTLPKESDSTLSRTYAPLSGISGWTSTGSDVNRDHIPSGESLNQRGDASAYNQGFTIAIPNKEHHQPFSPTWGTDNSLGKGMLDDNEGTSQRRVLFDRDNPSAAVSRDITFMLEKTKGQDDSSSHSHLDLTKSENRLRQVGGYRNLFHRNTQIHRHLGKKRGFNPADAALDWKANARVQKKGSKKASKRSGAYTYSKAKGKKQGELLAEKLKEHLIATGKANLI